MPSPLVIAAAPKPAGRWSAPHFLSASLGLHAMAAGAVALAPETLAWALGGVAANHLALTAASLWPRGTLLGPNLSRLPEAARARRAFALTLDDGPDPEVTPAVLDLLDYEGVRATFFCIAERALAHPALVRDIVARGHCVQNHSFRHHHHFSLLGPTAMAREIAHAQQVLTDITGVSPHCFRAPAGLRNPFLDRVLHHQGLQLVSWTRRGYDTRSGDAAAVLARLTRDLTAGDILLLHDGNARRTAGQRPVLLDVLPPLLARCRDAELRAETLRQAVPPRHLLCPP